MIRTSTWAIMFVSIFMFGCRSTPSPRAGAAALRVGDAAPKLAHAQWIQGPSVMEWTPGRVYVVDFWSPWCGPCHAAIPGLARLQREHKNSVQVVGVSIMPRLGMKSVERFVENHPEMTYAVAKDVDESIEREFWQRLEPRSLPGAVVVDRGGNIAWIGNPHPRADQAELREFVSELVMSEP